MQMENNWKVMKEENGKQHNGQNMLKEPGQFPAQDIPNDDEQLTMRDLTVGYDRIPLIKNINLGVRPGEILTLIGPNGSGKSTILKTITKQLKTIGGSVFLGKESMRELTDSEVSRHLSMVMTERIHTELLSGRDVVATGRYPYTGRLGILSQQDWKKVDEAIALVHAGEVQQQDFRRISDGQRQRLMLARAICQDTQVLILDEPTSYLDMGFKLIGEGFILIAQLSYGMSTVLINLFSKKVSPVVLSGTQFTMGGIVLTLIGIGMGGRLGNITTGGLSIIFYLALVSAVAYTLWSILLAWNDVSKVAIFGFVNPLCSVILSALILGEVKQAFNVGSLVALVLVCAGIYIVNRRKN